WVFISLVELYEIEKDEEVRQKYLKIFNRMYQSIKSFQNENGLFNTILTTQDISNYEDTSGNSIVLYSLLKAKRLGIINDSEVADKMVLPLIKKVKNLENDKALL